MIHDTITRYQAAATTIDGAIELFETVGMPARGLSVRTRAEYSSDLREFSRFLANAGFSQLGELSRHHLQAFQAHLDLAGRKPSSCRRKTQTLKVFCRFLKQEGIHASNIASELIPPRVPAREPRFLSEVEYKELLRACSYHPRDSALIELLLQTGMRLSEVARLTWEDIELPAKVTAEPDNVGFARILRKGGKTAQVPLNHKVCRALLNWQQARRSRRGSDTPAVFLSKYGQPLSKRAIQELVAKYLTAVGITGSSVHTLRHTMATHHIARGTDLKTVQETLGHADLSTTAMYVSLAKRAQRKALQENAL